MGRISLDTNLLVYATDPSAGSRRDIARRWLRRVGDTEGILTQQVIGEFLNVSRRSAHLNQRRLRRIALGLCSVFPIAPANRDALFEAFDLAQRHMLQFWDALIIVVCLRNDVVALLTEDMQDGQRFDALIVINPFLPDNQQIIENILTS